MKFSELAIGEVFTLFGDTTGLRKISDRAFQAVKSGLAYKVNHEHYEVEPIDPNTVVIGPRNRFDDAIEIQAGACNVIAIANALVKACKEFDEVKPRVGCYEEDPAIRLIVHQLAFLCRSAELDGFVAGPDEDSYTRITQVSRERAILEWNKK